MLTASMASWRDQGLVEALAVLNAMWRTHVHKHISTMSHSGRGSPARSNIRTGSPGTPT